MDRELIKLEYIKEVEILFTSLANDSDSAADKVNVWRKKLNKVDFFTDSILDKLDEVLNKNNITFDTDKDKQDLIEYLKPTTLSLIAKYVGK